MIYYRLTEDKDGMPEGACISEAKYKNVFYTDKILFEPIQDYEVRDMIEYEDDSYCAELGVEKMLFYTEIELQKFVNKQLENGIAG